METTDRELLVHLVDALSDMVFCLRSELMQDRCELDDKMTLLEIASFDDSRDPVQRRVKESWDDITRAAHRQHKHARERNPFMKSTPTLRSGTNEPKHGAPRSVARSITLGIDDALP